MRLRRATEEQVDRGLGAATTVGAQLYVTVHNLHVLIGRDDEHDAGLQGLTPGDRAHGQRAAPRQDIAEVTGVLRAEVLGQHDRGGKGGGQRRHERGERLDTPGGRTNHHERGILSLVLHSPIPFSDAHRPL